VAQDLWDSLPAGTQRTFDAAIRGGVLHGMLAMAKADPPIAFRLAREFVELRLSTTMD
jgi:hypothetical protein